jgi:predicted oxidoreductase
VKQGGKTLFDLNPAAVKRRTLATGTTRVNAGTWIRLLIGSQDMIQVEASLRRLKTDRLDLLFVHYFDRYAHRSDLASKRPCVPWIWCNRANCSIQALATGRPGRPVTLAVAWVMAHPAVTAPIIGARNLEQLNASLTAQDVPMTPEWWAEIAALSYEPPLATDRSEEKPV